MVGGGKPMLRISQMMTANTRVSKATLRMPLNAIRVRASPILLSHSPVAIKLFRLSLGRPPCWNCRSHAQHVHSKPRAYRGRGGSTPRREHSHGPNVSSFRGNVSTLPHCSSAKNGSSSFSTRCHIPITELVPDRMLLLGHRVHFCQSLRPALSLDGVPACRPGDVCPQGVHGVQGVIPGEVRCGDFLQGPAVPVEQPRVPRSVTDDPAEVARDRRDPVKVRGRVVFPGV